MVQTHLKELRTTEQMETLPGIGRTIARIQKAASLYATILQYSRKSPSPILNLEETLFFEQVLEHFGPCLPLSKVSVDLRKVFDVFFHAKK